VLVKVHDERVQDAADDLAELVLLGLVVRIGRQRGVVEQVAQPAGLPLGIDRPAELLADRAEARRLADRPAGLVEDRQPKGADC
jgi:hypothetical protein